MAFQFDQSAFPLLTPQQTSPLGGVLSDAIAKRLAMAKTQAEEEKAPYAGISSLSDAISKSAYAGAVMPQAQLKALENVMIASNIPETQRRQILGQAMGYLGANGAPGMSANPALSRLQTMLNEKLQQVSPPPQQQQTGSLGESIRRLLGGSSPQQSPAQDGGPPEINQPALDQFNRDRGQVAPVPPQEGNAPAQPQSGGSWFGNAGSAKGQLAQGEKEGTARAEAIAQYGNDAKFVLGQQRASKEILHLLQDPDIKGMIQIPFFNKLTTSAYRQAGKKEIQEKIGKLDTAINNYIAASPQRTDADKQFLISQKPNESDPLHVKLGKLAQLEIFNEANFEQMKLANQYVRSGIDQATAETMASQNVDLKKIEERINKEIFGKNYGKEKWGHVSDEELMRHIHG